MSAHANDQSQAASRWIVVSMLAVIGVLAAATYPYWRPLVGDVQNALAHRTTSPADEHDLQHEDTGENHGHAHTAHNNPNHIDLSPQAQKNIGLQIGPVALQPYERTITIPGMIVERPGRTSVAVAAPLTGIVTQITAVEGEAVAPGQELFKIRLTHEEIVQAQGEFLKTVAELDVTNREIKRIEAVVAEGAIAERVLLERKYEQEKQEAVLQAQREALLLHGLSAEQVTAIERDRKLLQGLTVYAPTSDEELANASPPAWQIQELKTSLGQHVEAGDTLAVLTDYRTLFIQGTAFEQDTREIQEAVAAGATVTALIDSGDSKPERIDSLKLVYTSGRVDPNSRTFHFFVSLPNHLLRDATNADGHRFVDWQFKPGQRVQLRVPVETWKDRLVLPVAAVAREGAESYVFQASGNSFQRRPVHEEYRDQLSVVIANDGSIFAGDFVALSGAQQLQIAVKNKSGGAIDPHAGHQH
ncbi:MAG: efflux RND transporter periplasmic adaptor subunit [Pirellulales bacterium]